MTSTAYGVDPVQALWLAFQKIGAELARLRASRGATLTWLGDEDLGFPGIP